MLFPFLLSIAGPLIIVLWTIPKLLRIVASVSDAMRAGELIDQETYDVIGSLTVVYLFLAAWILACDRFFNILT